MTGTTDPTTTGVWHRPRAGVPVPLIHVRLAAWEEARSIIADVASRHGRSLCCDQIDNDCMHARAARWWTDDGVQPPRNEIPTGTLHDMAVALVACDAAGDLSTRTLIELIEALRPIADHIDGGERTQVLVDEHVKPSTNERTVMAWLNGVDSDGWVAMTEWKWRQLADQIPFEWRRSRMKRVQP